MEIAVQHDDALGDVVERTAQHLQFVGVADDVGHVGIADHPAAIRQVRALHPDHLAIGPAQIERIGVACPHQTDALGDIGVDISGLDLVGLGVTAMIHQRDECRISIGDRIRQGPHATERAVDELRFHVGIEQQHADIDDIERRAQRQQLTPYDLFAALRLPGAVPGSFLFGRLRRLKHQTDLLIGLPGPSARLRLAFARDQQMEMLGNAEHVFNLDGGADVGHPADDAVDR